MLSREDRILSELIVSRGLATPETVERCARELNRSGEQDLVNALIAHGDLDPSAASAVRCEAREVKDLLQADLPCGRKLGEYRLVREIGRGGAGIVYEAEQESLRRRVALKVLPAGATLDERLAIRFLREARTAARLTHPGIVPVFATGSEQGVLFFAMELVEGESLAQRIDRGPISSHEAASIASEIARALQHAHEAGLIHRDVKPENVMIGSDGRARLTDFGLVHDSQGARLTRSHCVLGTPAYAAPEQARGAAADPRSDIYGVGAVLYAMLAGRPPYDGEVPAAVLGRLVTGPPRALAQVMPAVPDTLVEICERAMAREPRQRFADARCLAEALDRFGEGGGRSTGVARRSKRSLALVAAALALGVLFVATWSVVGGGGAATIAAGTASPLGLLRGTIRELPVVSGGKIYAALSPDGSTLAYTTYSASSVPHVHLTGVDSGDSERILPFDDVDTSRVFSPDGRRLGFCRGGRIEILEIATGAMTPIDAECGAMSWSADGTRIVVQERDWPQTRLKVIDPGTGEARLISGPGTAQPSWSPDGRIAYVALTDGQYDVWTVRDDGSDPRRVTFDAARENSPVWSSVEGRLYYASNLDFPYDIWEVDLDAATGERRSDPRRVTHGLIGTWVTLSAARERERLALVVGSDARQCWLLDLDSRAAPAAPPRVFDAELPCDAMVPRKAIDREDWITSRAENDGDSLFRYTPESGLTRITDGPYHDRSPRWSPDGTKIAFASDRSGRFEIWSVRPDGSELKRVTGSTAGARDPVWSPDGRWLAYHVEGRGAWVATVEDGRARPLEPDLAPAGFSPWSWSEDGSRIAGTGAGIVVVDLDRSRYLRVADFGEQPSWLGDGLVFTHDDSVYYWNGQDEPRIVWSGGPNRIVSLGVHPERRELVFETHASRERIWLLDLEAE